MIHPLVMYFAGGLPWLGLGCVVAVTLLGATVILISPFWPRGEASRRGFEVGLRRPDRGPD